MRVLVFGDSITQGFWAVNHGWVDRVRAAFDSQQIMNLDGSDKPTIFNLGISADNSNDVLRRIVHETKARTRSNHAVKPVVVVQIGVNDGSCEPTEPQVSIEQYQANLEQIITLVQPLSSKIIFIGSSACDEVKTMPVSWGQYYYSNKNIQSYERAMEVVASKRGVSYIPVYDSFMKELASGKNLLEDGLHPNEAGHKHMYEIIVPELEELLK